LINQNITLILYGTVGCHLCDDAMVIINNTFQAYSNTWMKDHLSIVDITDDDILYDKYYLSIPVLAVKVDEKTQEVRWPFNEDNIKALIK